MATQYLDTLPDAELYERDFYAWAKRQEAALLGKRWSELDIQNLAEEIADLGGSVERELESRFDVLIGHLIKLAVSADEPPRRKWWVTVRDQQDRIERRLQKNPSMIGKAPELFAAEWKSGVAHARTGLLNDDDERVPDERFLTYEQAMTVATDDELRALLPR